MSHTGNGTTHPYWMAESRSYGLRFEPANEPDKIITERDTTHGPYDRTAARAQTLKTATREGTNWHGMEPWARESLEMIEHKRARILEGNWRTEDHWLDIAGYAMLVVNLLRGQG